MDFNEWKQERAKNNTQRPQCKIFYAATLEGLEKAINQWLKENPMMYLTMPPVCMPSDHLWGMALFYEETPIFMSDETIEKLRGNPFFVDVPRSEGTPI